MPSERQVLCALAVLAVIGPARSSAQSPVPDLAREPVPVKPLRAEARRHQEALHLYAQGLSAERHNRLTEATRLIEQAARLDPTSAAVQRALVPLYLAQDRLDDALAACRRTLEIDPDDYETGYIYARHLRELGRTREALPVLARAVKSPALRTRPDAVAQMQSELAALAEEQGDPARAVAAYRAAGAALARLQRTPDILPEDAKVNADELAARRAECYEHILNLQVKQRHWDAAVHTYEEAKDKGLTRAARLSYPLARAYIGQGKLKEALAQLDEYLTRTRPAGTEAYELRNRVLKEMGQGGVILQTLEWYAQGDPGNVALQLLLAREYAAENLPEKARDLYNQLAKDSPSPQVYRGLFSQYREEDRGDRALEAFDKAVADSEDKSGGSASAALRARAMLAVFHDDKALLGELLTAAVERLDNGQSLRWSTERFLATLAGQAKQLDAAEKLYRACLDRGVTAHTEAEIYYGLLDVLGQARKYKAVIEVCRRGLKEARTVPTTEFHAELALALAFTKQPTEALAEADLLVKLADNPEMQARARRVRVQVYTQLDRFDKAVAECRALLKVSTKADDRYRVHQMLYEIYSLTQELAKAEAEVRWLIKADPAQPMNYNNLGYLLADQGKDLPLAEELIRKALRLERERKKASPKLTTEENQNPEIDSAAIVDSLGWVLFRRGRVDAAREQLEKASTLPDGADDPVIWDHLGDVYFRLHLVDQAQSVWKKAVTLYESGTSRKPDDQYKQIKHKLKLLEGQSRR